MGYGRYSYDAHSAMTESRSHLPQKEVFKQKGTHPLMDPFGVKFRESRDSDAHPNSLGIVFALDVTGSMGNIPVHLAQFELPNFMKVLLDYKVQDPQVMFMAVGDVTCDKGPLQVGQFESAEGEMDRWLTWMWLEGGGGGSERESYETAMYFAARHTVMDCWEKRKKRGYFFVTGDENAYDEVSREIASVLIGDEIQSDIPTESIVRELQKTFNVFFLIPDRDRASRCASEWHGLLGDHVITMNSHEDTCAVAAGIIALMEGAAKLETLQVKPSVRKALDPFAKSTKLLGR